MKVIEILTILEKYMQDYQKTYSLWAEHDVIGFNVDYELISMKDLQRLNELGVFFSSEYDSLIMFV